MTHEERASLIQKIFLVVLLAAIAAGVWSYSKPGKVAPLQPAVVTASPENSLSIVLHHLPGDPAGEQLAAILDRIQNKYGKLVIVSRVDSKLHPETSKAQGVTKSPHVIIIAGTEKVFEFQGLWSQAKVEQKVDEILRGIKRVGKDWRPEVKGMTRAGGQK